MMKKDKNNLNINSIPKYLWGNYFKKPIKWLAHLINNYGNSKHPFITTGTSYAYAIGDEKRRHPELTELQIREIVNSRIKQNRKKLGLPTDNNTTPSLAAAGLALGSVYYPWLAVPDIIFDTAASIDEPSTSNNIHTIADFPETVAKFTPSKIDDYVAKGVLTLGNIDDAVSTSGRNMFSNFDKKPGKINNTTDKTSVRESTNIRYRKNGGYIRKMLTAAGGPIKKPIKRLKDGYRYIPDEENGGWDRISDNAMSDVFATYVVKGKDKRADVRIDKKSENFDRKFKYDETEIPFIKDKEITLTNAGLYTGAKLSTNLLDSIAKYAKISGLPLKTAVGLVAKETSLGNPTVDSSLKKLAGDDFAYQLAKALNGGLHINEGKALNPKDLINFHYEELNPYLGLKNIAYKKSVGNMGDYGREGPFGDEDFLKRYRELLKLGENYSDNLAKKLLSNFNPNKNVLQAGFEFYKLNPRKYNYNQTNYPLLVEERGNMVYNSPEFKSWLSTSEYKKQGGKINILEFLKKGGQVRKMQTAAGGPIYWLRKRLYNNIEPFGYNDVGSRLIDAIVLNKNEHDNFKGNYADPEKVPAVYQTVNDLWREYLHIPEEEGMYSNGKYKIKNNGNGTFSLPFESMKDIMQAVNSNNPLLWGLRGKLGNSVVGEYDVHRGYDKNGDYLKYIDHWRINPYDVKDGKDYGLDNNSLLKWYFKGKDDASFGLGTPVEIQGKYYLDDIYNVKGKDRGGHYLPEIIVTGKKKQGGKMDIIKLFKEGGKVRKMLTASGGPIELYNTLWVDNWRNRLTSPVVVAKQLEKLTSKIPIKYLGGSKDNARKEFWKQEPVLQHAVDSVASLYRINPESLKYRLDKEGFTDRLIQRRNNRIKIGALRFEPRGYELLNNPNYGLDGTQIGLDDAKTYIDSGKVKLINENWDERGPFKNEKGRMTYPVNPVTLNDGMGIVAAHLKYFRDEALLDFPNGSEYDLDRYANAYYNRGTYGGKKWVLAGAKGYNYRKKGGMLEFLKNGSGIHIKEKNKGKFTSYCGGKVTDECILKGKNSSNPAIRKRATFAANARKWKHLDGGIIKAEGGTKTNWWSKIGEGINKGVNSKAGLYIAQGLLLGLGSIFGGNNSSDISNAAKGYIEMQELWLDENELRRLNSLLNSNIDPENPNAVEGIPKQVLYGKIYDIEQRNLKRKLKLEKEEMESLLNTLKSNLYLDMFSTALGMISNNSSSNKDTSSSNKNASLNTSTTSNSYFDNYFNSKYKKFGTFNPDGSMNMLGGTFTIKDGYKPNQPQLFNYQPPKLNV